MIDLKQVALELALNIERRGSLEGHYVWSDMLIHALHNAYNEGLEDAALYLQENGFLGNSPKEIRGMKK